MTAREPTMSIGNVVAELRATFPDVSHSSLRFLEREGFVSPARTPGGHRLYTRADLDQILRIKRWQANRLSLDEIRTRLANPDAPHATNEMGDRFLAQAIDGSAVDAMHTILEADDYGLPMTRIFDDVLGPSLRDLALRRASGEITYGQEHETAVLIGDLVADFTVRHADPCPGWPVIVAACVEGEMHDLGLRMITAALRQRGARVHYLGANVAAEPLVATCRDRDPDLVLLSTTVSASVATLISTVNALRTDRGATSRPAIVAGGIACAPRVARHIGADLVMPQETPLEEIIERLFALAPARATA
jgi:methanogenic corrinoid protein MtbC1